MLKKSVVFILFAVALIGCSNNAADTTAVEPIEVTETAAATKKSPIPALSFEIPDVEIPLAGPGPYAFSMIPEIIYHDEERDGREISISIFYPSRDAEPDLRGAPFPLIINDYKMFFTFGTHLASHGFIVAGINDITSDSWNEIFLNQPLDYVFVLNQLADNPPELLEGIIDTNHVGVWGYSFGGRNSVFLSGGRIDPEYYFKNCENPDESTIEFGPRGIEFMCVGYENWDDFVGQAGSAITDSDDGLWQPITDERIIATIPMSSTGEWLFGPRGFASADKAVLLTAGTNEDPYYIESYRIFEELGTSEKIFISFVRKDHNMIYGSDAPKKMQHLAIAFFSHHLKGYDEYTHFYSEEFISEVEGLAWGWYEE